VLLSRTTVYAWFIGLQTLQRLDTSTLCFKWKHFNP